MKLRQFHQKSVSGARKVTSMVKPLQSLHLREIAVAQPVGAGPVRKVTEAQHEARAGVKGKGGEEAFKVEKNWGHFHTYFLKYVKIVLFIQKYKEFFLFFCGGNQTM